MIRGVAGRAGWLIIGLGLIVTALFWILLASPHGRRSASARTGGVRDSPGPPADPAVAASGAADEEIAPGREPFASARRLRIRVVSATAPLPDAEIRFDGDPACVVTGSDGVAELGTEELGVVFVVASKEGFREVEKAVPGGVDEAEIALVPGVPLRGRVVRAADGAPVPGALVRAVEQAGCSDLCRTLTADAEGRFTVPGVAQGTAFVIAAAAPGFFPASSTGVAGTTPAEVRIVLGEGGRLEGRVRDGDGRAAAGARIRVFPANDDFLSRSFESEVMEQTRLRAAARAVTDPDGSYAVEGIPPGEHAVLALGASGASAKATFAVARPGDTLRIDLALEPTGAIVVRVLDPDGHPVPRARLGISDSAGKWCHGSRVDNFTDEGGEGAATGLEPGTYSVLVQPGEWTAVRARAVVERGPPVEVELRVERGVALEGTVRDPAGNPVAGLDVQFTISGDAQSPPQLKAAVTLRDGRFVLKGLLPLPGTLNVSDWAERWDSWTGDALPGSPSLSIVVRRTPSVSGRFEPPPEARRIAYTVVAGDWITGRWDLDLDAEGRFLLPGLEEGLDLSLVFEVPGACLVRRAIAPLVPGEQRDLGTLVVAEGLALRGRAVDEHGEPWALTRVQLTYEDWGIDQYVLTDGMGRFAFENVDPSAQLALTVWSSENAGEYFDLDDWPAKPVHELVVERPR